MLAYQGAGADDQRLQLIKVTDESDQVLHILTTLHACSLQSTNADAGTTLSQHGVIPAFGRPLTCKDITALQQQMISQLSMIG